MEDIKYFKLNSEYIVTLPDHIEFTIPKDSIFHMQSRYQSPLTGDDMAVISIDKCTPLAVPVSAGSILD